MTGPASPRGRYGPSMCLLGGAVVVGLLSGCGTDTPGGDPTGRNSTKSPVVATHTDSDPGDKKLHMMAADPVFAQLPAPLRKDSETDTPARYETPGFGSGGSFGASVTVMFTGPSDMKQVYTLIAQSAANNGWTPKGSDSAGITNRWVKTYPDGSYATLLLSRTDPKSSTSTAYTLEGGI